jgi:hypothetical protein
VVSRVQDQSSMLHISRLGTIYPKMGLVQLIDSVGFFRVEKVQVFRWPAQLLSSSCRLPYRTILLFASVLILEGILYLEGISNQVL